MEPDSAPKIRPRCSPFQNHHHGQAGGLGFLPIAQPNEIKWRGPAGWAMLTHFPSPHETSVFLLTFVQAIDIVEIGGKDNR